jgi:hypothetical protein
MIAVNPRRQKGAARVSVIGRLDGQVEEVIINPIGRRPTSGEDDASAIPPAPQEPAETTTPEPGEQRRGERHEPAELPVWLL